MEHSGAPEMLFLNSSWKILVLKKKTKSIPIPGRGEIFDQSWGDLKIGKILCIFLYFHYISFVNEILYTSLYKRNIVEIQKNATDFPNFQVAPTLIEDFSTTRNRNRLRFFLNTGIFHELSENSISEAMECSTKKPI